MKGRIAIKLAIIFKVTLGFLALLFATIGLFIPVWPTTPFVLVAIGCFSSTPKIRNRLLEISYFREYYESYTSGKGIRGRTMISSLVFLWGMLIISMVLISRLPITLILVFIGTCVTIHILSKSEYIMKTKSSLSIPKRIEIIFDSAYLISALVLGICLMIYKNSPVTMLWGIMSITLALGDSFHLVPRIASAYTNNSLKFTRAMGIGKFFTSITMTIFYVLLWHSGIKIFSLSLPRLTIFLYILAGIRIILCLFPQNNWQHGGESFGIARNVPFLLQGLLVMWLYAVYGSGLPAIRFVWLAILISFACYMPVVLWVSKNPKLGMLMLPKTCAYLWIISIGFWI